MKSTAATGISLMLAMLLVAATGCDTVGDVFEKDKEATGLVEAVDATSLTVDGIVYVVTDTTEYDGITGLSDLTVGDEVEIDYKDRGDGAREALEVELAGAPDDDSDGG